VALTSIAIATGSYCTCINLDARANWPQCIANDIEPTVSAGSELPLSANDGIVSTASLVVGVAAIVGGARVAFWGALAMAIPRASV